MGRREPARASLCLRELAKEVGRGGERQGSGRPTEGRQGVLPTYSIPKTKANDAHRHPYARHCPEHLYYINSLNPLDNQ